jgi:putative selenate reductase
MQKAFTELDSQMQSAGETERCLECKVLCNKCVEVCPNRANVAVKVPNMKNENQILHLDAFCNECGNCETFCPHDGAPYKDKFTLFQTEKDFADSQNSGFLPLKTQAEFKLRLNGDVSQINLQRPATYQNLDTKYIDFIETVVKEHGYLLWK